LFTLDDGREEIAFGCADLDGLELFGGEGVTGGPGGGCAVYTLLPGCELGVLVGLLEGDELGLDCRELGLDIEECGVGVLGVRRSVCG
jgi:hypothetical protein